MLKRQKEVLQHQLDNEEAVLKALEKHYRDALEDINMAIRIMQSDELTQSKVYRIQYQQSLKKQVEGILEKLHSDEYSTLQQFLSSTYTDAFVGTMYDLHAQKVPVLIPVDRKNAVKAVLTDSKLTSPLYDELGIDINSLKKTIRAEITRGIASGMTFDDIARNIASVSKAPMSRAKSIARTEGHRIQQASMDDARMAAKAKGADVVKQWDSTMDGATRPVHRELDGQIREVDEPFEAHGKKAMYPGDFGDPAEDCNCRCAALTRARKAMDADELKTLQERAEFFGLDKTKDFDDFKEKYMKAVAREAEVSFWDLKGGKPEVEYSVALANRFEEGTDIAKAVYQKYVPEGGAVADAQYKDIAHYQDGYVYMNYADDAVNVRGAGTTFFHEHGHYVDAKAGDTSHSPKYIQALKNDIKAMYAATGHRNKRDAEYAITVMLSNGDAKNKVNGISDIVYGLTNGKAGGRWYHRKKGYYKGYALQEEAFAHMFEASFSTEKQMLMKRYFPTAWEVFNEMMEGIK